MIPFALPPRLGAAIPISEEASTLSFFHTQLLPKVFQALLLLHLSYRYSTHCLCGKLLSGTGISVSAALIFLLLQLGGEMIRNDAIWQGAKPEPHYFCVTTP